MFRLILLFFMLAAIVSCSSYVTPVPSPIDCGNNSFTQKSAVKSESCVAVTQLQTDPKRKSLWGRTTVFWPQKTTLKVKFIGGDSGQRAYAWKRFEVVNSLSNLKYVKVDVGNSDIRVDFDLTGGHWSYIGIYNKNIPQNQKTMNIGLNGSEGNDEWDRVVIHEVLHSAGFFHELQHPYYTIPWNTQVVLNYYRRTQGWSDQQIHQQVLDRADPSNFNGTSFDPDSIMCYPVSPEFTTSGFSVGWNYKLSPCDVSFIQKVYPK